jgi:secreted PhoX family phosphatase
MVDILERVDDGRRRFIKTALSSPLLAALGGVSIGGLVQTMSASPVPPSAGFAGIGFESIPPSVPQLDAQGRIVTPIADEVRVPTGYRVELLAAWGDPITRQGKDWLSDASQSSKDQEQQFGMHNDGMHFFPFVGRDGNPVSDRGLLCVNHEYTHESVLHADGLDYLSGGLEGSEATIAKIRKSQAAHGVSVMEIRRLGSGKWEIVRDSRYNRRITANTPMQMSGPAAGHALLKQKRYVINDARSTETGQMTSGYEAWGTANNCAHGYTPWGTYITCEENWNGYHGWKDAGKTGSKLENRYGVTKDGFTTSPRGTSTSIYKWHVLDDRFDTGVNPNGVNTFGWRVEIDPWNPRATPVKRTAMGRFKCESAGLAVDPDNRFAFYMGDDERNEYIYKFVPSKAFDPINRAANKDLLDEGILYVAKFTDTPGATDGTYRGRWIPLQPDTETVIVDPANKGRMLRLREVEDLKGADDAEVQAKICIMTRIAADAVGATMMDRPEWTAVRPRVNGYTKLEVYCTLTNNNRRGDNRVSVNKPDGTAFAGGSRPPVDVANPRPDNDYGHIIRWREDGDTVRATAFEWDIFVLCGDTQANQHFPAPKNLPGGYSDAADSHDGYQGNIFAVPYGSADFGAPDGLWFDDFGRLWIQTDQAGEGTGDWQRIGSNTMLCADPNTKEIRRFLTSPPQCEVTGVIGTPDGKTVFVGIQHPGEDALADEPMAGSNWPASQFGTPSGRPRASVLAISRVDGGVVGGL